MVRFVFSQLRAAPGRAVVLGIGLLIAAAGFSVLSSVSVSSAVTVRGTLNRNFQPAYDILVRPRGSVTSLERSQRLVDDGFLSSLYGGISTAQWRRILGLRGVSVAAPVENVGYTLAGVEVNVSLRSVVGPGAQQIFRVVPSFEVHGGLASYPDVDQYFYYSRDRWVQRAGASAPSLVVPGRKKPVGACRVYVHGKPPMHLGPFASRPLEGMTCAGPRQRVRGVRYVIDRPGRDMVQFPFEVPVLVAAIDPAQEAKLVGLSGAMVHGSYLRISCRNRGWCHRPGKGGQRPPRESIASAMTAHGEW